MHIRETGIRGQRALSLALAAIFSCSAGAAALDSAKMGQAEDGTDYVIATAADDQTAMRDQWQERKVHPSVSQQAFTQDEVRVIIYMYDNQTTRMSRVSSAKAPFETQLNVMAEEIRQIERKYRPEHSGQPDLNHESALSCDLK